MTFETLEHPIRWLFIVHAVFGGAALLVLLLPLYSKKGGSLHVKTGWIYTIAMIVVGLSAFVITPWRAFFDPSRSESSIGFSAFLFFIAAFTLVSIWFGLFTLKHKKRTEPLKSFLSLGPPIFLLFLGVIIQLLGYKLGNLLLILFPFLAHFTARTQLQYWLKVPTYKMHWWYAHMNGMITASIATITAFLVTALPRVWPSPISQSPILWIAPGIILGTVANRWTKKYQEKFNE